MEYPLYEYYKNRSLTLDEIVDHYVTRFYAKKHDGKAVLMQFFCFFLFLTNFFIIFFANFVVVIYDY